MSSSKVYSSRSAWGEIQGKLYSGLWAGESWGELG
jgi:hypothetical protein